MLAAMTPQVEQPDLNRLAIYRKVASNSGEYMNKMNVFGLALLALLVPGGLLFAHHGVAGFYDQDRIVKVEGVVRQFDWRNPHCGLFIVAKDAAGNEVSYALEMGSPGSLARQGFTRNSIKPGDKVLAPFHPAFANPTAGELESRDVVVNGKAVVTYDMSALKED
jgi:Family of unknown function (DUF6152)